jgi:alpha-D-ribose 1-methylphosphonate 5-triphosphate synthase subunit PhnH
MQAGVLEGGFVNGPIDAAYAFRAVMTAMARPGEIGTVTGARPPAPMSVAAGVVALTLFDPETPVYLAPGHDTQEVRDWITFHTGAPFCAPELAMFAVGEWDALPIAAFGVGTAEYPDRSATLIIERAALSNTGATLRGPGIEGQAHLFLPEMEVFQQNKRLFPLGLDFIFTCGDRLAALPRTTRVSASGSSAQEVS